MIGDKKEVMYIIYKMENKRLYYYAGAGQWSSRKLDSIKYSKGEAEDLQKIVGGNVTYIK